jgi:hypothetical protein
VPKVSVSLGIYNSAGELVYWVAQNMDVDQSIAPQGLSVSGGALVPGMAGSAASLYLIGSGMSLNWNGANSNGQWVQSGTYIASMTVTDPYGKVSSYSSNITVLNQNSMSVSVYNSAGELVRHMSGPLPTQMTAPVFSTESFSPEAGGQLLISYNSGLSSLVWDGKNDQGKLVSGGMYLVKVELSLPGQLPELWAKSVEVLRAPGADILAAAIVAPNPASLRDAKVLVSLGDLNSSARVRADIYDLAGEHVASADNSDEPGRIVWDLGNGRYAPGTYFIVLQVEGAKQFRRVLKLALTR